MGYITLQEYLADHYGDLLKLSLMITRDFDLAREVLHRVIVRLLRTDQQGKLPQIHDYPAFLAACIRRTSISCYRERMKMIPTDRAVIEAMRADLGNRQLFDFAEWMLTIEQRLLAYKPELQEAFLAYYLDGVPLKELAEQMEISTDALRHCFMRMRKQMKRLDGDLYDNCT